MEQTVQQRLQSDLKVAMRSGDTTTRDAIRYILAALKNTEIDRRGQLTEADAEATLRKLGKQLADSVDQFRAGHREDLAAKELAQLDVLKRYLPEEMSDEDLAALANAVVAELGATGPKDMSKVMPMLIERTGGRADGRRASAAARSALAAVAG
ncbi:MAG: GatB/YqeY domain-containing protein [Thermomicrobiales bacterium]|nr:GatB/YqeY domain-containing protein [Thermomicrobiales bacterium]